MEQATVQSAVPYQQYQGQQVANFSPFQQAAQGAMANMQAVPDAANTAGQMTTNVANQSAMWNPQFNTSQIDPMMAQASQVYQQGYNPNAGVSAQQTSVQNWTDPGVSQQYMSPYVQNVMDAQKANMNVDYQMGVNQAHDQAAASGAFGGDRQAVQDAAMNRTYNQQLQSMEANALNSAYGQGQNTFLGSQGQSLQSQQANQQTGLQAGLANQNAYNQAGQFNSSLGLQQQGMNQNAGLQAQTANQGANLQGQSLNNQYGLQGQNYAAQYGLQNMQTQLGAANQLGSLAQSQQNMGLNWINGMNQMGGQQQAQQQNLLGTAQQNWNAGQNWNTQQQGNLSNILHGIPVTPSYTSAQTQASPSVTGMLGGLGALAMGGAQSGTGATATSDRRLKKDIEDLGVAPNGLRSYRFRYVWEHGTPKHTGHMAQEVRELYPEAVQESPDGYLSIDYALVPRMYA
jgi:uncharacterized protein (DUF2147 family)